MKNINGTQPVAIVNSDIEKWGTAVNRARLLTQELVRLERFDLSDRAKELFDECVIGFNEAYDNTREE